MAEILLGENKIQTFGELPAIGSTAPAFSGTTQKLQDVELDSFEGLKVLNIFPSVDTGICALSVKTFNAKAGSANGVTVLNISMDLPMALKRFCGAEGLEGVISLSMFRNTSFLSDYGLGIKTGPLRGLCSRAVLVLDSNNKVLHTEQVQSIGQEPNYDAALAALG